MKTALILHGIGGDSNDNWIPWLASEMKKKGWVVIAPNLPKPKHPDRSEWLSTASELVQNVDFSKLTIIGHSLGVTTALDLIEDMGKFVDQLVSVSGFAWDYGFKLNDYFLKERFIDLEKVKKLIGVAHAVYGDDDPYVTQDTLKGLADGLGVEPFVINGGKHLNSKAGYNKFPLLLELLV